jgi:hypothetical protein
MCTACRTALLCFLFLGIRELSGQQEDQLDRVAALSAAGRLSEARVTLERWQTQNQNSNVPGETRARVLMLSAQLAVDTEAALDAYRSVALSYPTSRYAGEALLRLGQGLVASATASGGDLRDAERAIVYLARLISDHPRSAQRTLAIAWLAHAHLAAGQRDEACRIAGSRRNEVSADPQAMVLLRDAESASCRMPQRFEANIVSDLHVENARR